MKRTDALSLRGHDDAAHTRPTRPWCRRKQVWAALALWLAISFPLAVGPLAYSRNRWGLGAEFREFHMPVMRAFDQIPRLGAAYDACVVWWSRLGARLAADTAASG